MNIERGQPLPLEVAMTIKKNLLQNYWPLVASKTGVSASTIRNIVNRQQAINNPKHVQIARELLRAANDKARQKLIKAKEDIDFLNECRVL